MRISISSLPSNQEAVDAINSKLGTKFTVFDYKAWENGTGSPEFEKAVSDYVGNKLFKVATSLFIAMHRIKRKFKPTK